MDDIQLKHRRELAVERMSRMRQRQRAGYRCTYVDVHDSEVEELVRRGLLEAGDAGDPYAVGYALSALLGKVLA